jgi:putative PIN family toxin of toxin-antitoxin system
LRAVFDTNVLVSAVLFREGRLSWLRDAWKSRRLVPVLDRACIDELLRVLAYPKFDLSPQDVKVLLEDLVPFSELVESRPILDTALPECRDPDDQKFLALAVASKVDVLVTGDGALLELAGTVPVEVESPTQLRARYRG